MLTTPMLTTSPVLAYSLNIGMNGVTTALGITTPHVMHVHLLVTPLVM